MQKTLNFILSLPIAKLLPVLLALLVGDGMLTILFALDFLQTHNWLNLSIAVVNAGVTVFLARLVAWLVGYWLEHKSD